MQLGILINQHCKNGSTSHIAGQKPTDTLKEMTKSLKPQGDRFIPLSLDINDEGSLQKTALCIGVNCMKYTQHMENTWEMKGDRGEGQAVQYSAFFCELIIKIYLAKALLPAFHAH